MRAVDLDATGNAVGASFPAALMAPLGTGWAWTASVSVDGTLVDICDKPIPPATRPSTTAAPTEIAAPVPVGWGPEVPHFAVGGPADGRRRTVAG